MTTKLQPYKNYKPVTYDYVTQLPEGWQLLPNIAIFEERIERGYINEALLSVTIGKGVIKQSDLDKKDSSTLDKSKYLFVNPNDLVYSMRFRQGASGYSDYRGIVSPACTVLKHKKGMNLNSRYFHYMFRSGFYKNYVERYAYGIADGQMPLRYFDFKRMYSIVPPLEDQNSIVDYLDKKNNEIDKFIRNKEKLIELLDEQRKSVVFHRLKEFFISCKKKVKFLVRICNGLEQKAVEDINGQYPIYGSGGIIGYANKYLHDKPSVLLGRKGTVDKPILVNQPFWSIDTAFYTIINEKKVIPKFFFYACTFINFDEYKYGSAIPSMTQGMLNNIEIPAPDIVKQIELIQFLEIDLRRIDLAITNAQQEITAIKEYREALITDLVTGKRRIPQ